MLICICMLSKSSKYASIIFDEDVILYFTSFKAQDGFLLIYNDKKYLYTDMRYYNMAVKLANAEVKLIETDIVFTISKFVKSNNVETLGLIYSLTSTDIFVKLNLLGVKIVDIELDIDKLRYIKSNDEISLIKTAHSIAEKSFNETLKIIKTGVTEKEIASYLEYRFKANGADGASFETIVAFNENSAIPHYQTGDVKLKENSVILIDFGCKYKGYCSDTTRTFIFGDYTSEFKNVYDSVLTAHNLAFDNITNNLSCVEADAISRNYLKTCGLDSYFTHSLGHGVGVKIHEAPKLSKNSNSVLVNGNCFSIEPGVYLSGKFGVRIEDTVYLENGKVKSFNKISKELFTVKP